MKRLLIIVPLLILANIARARISVDFYGHELLIRNHSISRLSLSSVNERTLASFEKSIQKTEIENLTREIDSLKTAFNLDDVGCIQLISKIARGVYPDRNRSQFLRWALLKKQRYRVVLTYEDNELSTFGVLGFSPSNAVYIMLQGEKFTNLDFRDYRLAGKRKIYGKSLEGRAMYLNTGKKPRINKKIVHRKLVFHYMNREIVISASGNASMMEYIRDLPTLSIDRVYLDYGVSDELRQTLFAELNRHMNGMSQRDKLSFLLKFVQQTFNYASDQVVYGKEKFNFPEETIFENYSDCDDRVILLACLYKELLGLNSVALMFGNDDHMSMAVHVPGTTVGGSFRYAGKSYYTCEPTSSSYLFGRSALPLGKITEVYKLY